MNPLSKDSVKGAIVTIYTLNNSFNTVFTYRIHFESEQQLISQNFCKKLKKQFFKHFTQTEIPDEP